jgi:methyltransferase
MHAGWLGGCIAEDYWRQPGPGLASSITAFILLMLGQCLRFAAMAALQEHWTVRILILPGVPPVTHGIYRYIRHPNYAGVILEIVALPALSGCWSTAIVCSIANGIVVWIRIRAEETALQTAGGYEQAFAHIGRFFP